MSAAYPPLTILAADDTRTNLRLLEVFIGKLGHRVETAANGQEAIDQFIRLQPDLVLMDIMMPVMDGFEAAKHIKTLSQERWVPIIFLSALDRDQNLLAGLEAGGDDYLSKPINFVILEAKLRSLQKALAFQNEALVGRKRIESLSNSITDAIITIDAEGCIVHVNYATEVIFQWPLQELLGKNVSLLMPEPHRSAHDDYLRAYLGGGPPNILGSRREVLAQRRDGSTFVADLSVSEMREGHKRLFTGIIRDITEERRTREERDEYYLAMKDEQDLAQQLVDLQLHRPGLDDPLIRYWIAPTATFSGDVVAAARSPGGLRYALLADATGHGLAAAISVLPVLALFYRMTAQHRDVNEIIHEFNQQLRESVPAGRFVALALVCVDESRQRGEIWVGGTPPPLLIDAQGQILERFPSTHVPLGILGSEELGTTPVEFPWQPGQQIVLYSDGLIEAENAAGEPFGKGGLEATLAIGNAPQRLDTLVGALDTHLRGVTAKDDVSLLLLSHS